MKSQTKKRRFFPALPLALLLIGGSLLLVACGGAEKETLTKQVAELQDKAKSLEQKINERDGQIKKFEEERKDLSGRIPEYHVVAPGESHWQIAYDFLTAKKGVPAEKAGALLADSILFDKVLIGHRVYNYFADDVFATFLTKGEATVSPGQMRQAEIKARDEEKTKLVREIGELEKRNAAGEEKFVELNETWTAREKILENRAKGLDADLAKLNAQTGELETKLNSVYYLIGARDNLKGAGIIKGTFLGICGDRVKNVTLANFQKSLDLRSGNVIKLAAGDFGLPKIRKVMLFPRDLQEGVDYRVERAADGASATLHLLNKDKFILSRVIISLD
jgi:cell division protein FtsB